MRNIVGRLALLLGVFALVAAGVAQFWGKDAAERTPLNVDSYTRLTGSASGALAKSDLPVPVKYVTHTIADSKASDGKVIAIRQTSCINVASTDDAPWCIDGKGNFVLDASDPSIVNIGDKKFALDRKSALPVKDQAKYVKDSSAVQPYEGLVIKFPFHTEKKDYPYWDGTLGRSVTAEYKGERTIDGLKTYEFAVDIPPTQAEVAADTQGTYAATQNIWIDPETGAFVDQKGTQTVTLPDGSSALDIQVSYTDATVKTNVATAKDNGRSLWLVSTLLPIGGLVLGLVLIVAGILLLRRRPGSHDGAHSAAAHDRRSSAGGVTLTKG